MNGLCSRCKTVFDKRHYRNHTNLCDACYIDSRIRNRVKERTSYNGHLGDIELLIDKYDWLISELDDIKEKLFDLYPGTIEKVVRRIETIVETHKKID